MADPKIDAIPLDIYFIAKGHQRFSKRSYPLLYLKGLGNYRQSKLEVGKKSVFV